ncbi:MAG: hypothetical protein AB1641_17075 [Thermodesulfobacteriota bacterium]
MTAVELVAQTAAAVSIWRELGGPSQDNFGFVAGLKMAVFYADQFMIGSELSIDVRCPHLVESDGLFYGVFAGQVREGEHLLAEASLQIFRPRPGDYEFLNNGETAA